MAWMDLQSRSALLAGACLLAIAASCGSSDRPVVPAKASDPAPALETRPAGRMVFRPRLTFTGGRTSNAGVAFLLDSVEPTAVIPSHVVLALLKRDSLEAIALTDAATHDVLARVEGLAAEPGAPMDGFDYSTDVAIVRLAAIPDGVARLRLATSRPTIDDEVDIVSCPADASAPQIVVSATVRYAGADRLEVVFSPPGETRGMAGSPILSKRTGEVVGVLQTVGVGARAGTALGRATPADGVARALADAMQTKRTLALSAWKAPSAAR